MELASARMLGKLVMSTVPDSLSVVHCRMIWLANPAPSSQSPALRMGSVSPSMGQLSLCTICRPVGLLKAAPSTR